MTASPSDFVVAGLLLAMAVLVGMTRDRSDRRVGVLLVITSLLWFAAPQTASSNAALSFVGARLAYLHRATLTHALLHRAGRSTFATSIVVAMYVVSLVTPWGRHLLVWAAISMVLLAVEFTRAPRSSVGLSSLGAFALWVASLVVLGCAAAGMPTGLDSADVAHAYEWTVAAAAAIAAIATVARRSMPGSAGSILDGTVSGLAAPMPHAAIRRALANALDDPQLEVLFAALGVGVGGGWVDELGQRREKPGSTDDRRTTVFQSSAGPVALVHHEASLAADPRMMDALRASVTLAAANVSLRARLAAEVEAVRLARVRVLGAAEDARRSIAEQLRRGAAAHLDRAEDLLRSEAETAAFVDGLRLTRSELTSLAAGIGSATVNAIGLEAALRQLGGDSLQLRVRVDAVPVDLEATVYFLAAEGVTNAIKHADASEARVDVIHSGDSVEVVVADNGRGGADLHAGTGLDGLRGRVAERGGTLHIASDESGTTLRARLPVAQPPMRIQVLA